jgi:hypothetical protein
MSCRLTHTLIQLFLQRRPLEATAPIEALSEALRINESLTHLDLSHCQLDALDCQGIAEGLHQNHTLLGLHMDGRQPTVIHSDSPSYTMIAPHTYE